VCSLTRSFGSAYRILSGNRCPYPPLPITPRAPDLVAESVSYVVPSYNPYLNRLHDA
jgi:hypothetical protein